MRIGIGLGLSGRAVASSGGGADDFGTIVGTMTKTASVNDDPTAVTGSVAVAVGDLIFTVVAQTTNLTANAITDNLGNTYTAQNAGNDAGAMTGRAFYSIAANAGTLTSQSIDLTAAASNAMGIVTGVFNGPFGAISANPSNSTADTTSPFTCPATGTLASQPQLVLGWAATNDGIGALSAVSPMTLAATAGAGGASNARASLAHQLVSATTTVSPEFTAGGNPSVIVLGTCSFPRA